MSSVNCDEDVQRIKKRLEKMMKSNDVDVSQSIDMLNFLKNLPINLQVLTNTRIGVVVNNLRKASNSDELGTLAKNLLKSWKRLVAGENSGHNTSGSNNNNPISPNSNFDDRENSNSTKSPPPPATPPIIQHQMSTSSSSSSSGNNKEKEISRRSSNDLNNSTNGHNNKKLNTQTSSISTTTTTIKTPITPNYSRTVSYSDTRDQVRIKSRELIEAALQLTEHIDKNIPLYDAHAIACRCEDVIFTEFKNTDAKYKNRIRSRIANLKDPKNPKLKEQVLIGKITAEQLAVMTADDMASDELKQLREKFTLEAIDDHKMAVQTGCKSSLLKCGKCKKSNCGYKEMQTRSADEPMTVFAFCFDCGHRWKFG